MIIKYSKFNSINEWKNELMDNVKILANEYITAESIEDYFLELKDDGFSIKIDILASVGSNIDGYASRNVSRKSDITSNKCYPVYEVNIEKKWNSIGNLSSAQKRLQYYDNCIGRYKIACERLESLHDNIEVSSNKVDIYNTSILFRTKIRIKKQIPYNFVDIEMSDKNKLKYLLKQPYHKILNIISNNKIFNIEKDSIEGEVIRFSVVEEYKNLDIDNILFRILRSIDKISIKKIDNIYEITIL